VGASATAGKASDEVRSRARAVVISFGAAVAMGIALLVLFEPDVQRDNATELLFRKDDARDFFIGDFAFVLLYAVLSPIAIWRFAQVADPRWRRGLTGAVVLLPMAGLVDATENVLLWSSVGEFSPDAVHTAHALAYPKFALFAAGAAFGVYALVKAIRALR